MIRSEKVNKTTLKLYSYSFKYRYNFIKEFITPATRLSHQKLISIAFLLKQYVQELWHYTALKFNVH